MGVEWGTRARAYLVRPVAGAYALRLLSSGERISNKGAVGHAGGSSQRPSVDAKRVPGACSLHDEMRW